MTPSSDGNALVAALREQLERIDAELVILLARRVALAREIGDHKRDAGLGALDAGREAAVIRRAGTLAREAGLPEEPARQLFWQIIGMCRQVQQEAP